jgi:hypothetical protein
VGLPLSNLPQHLRRSSCRCLWPRLASHEAFHLCIVIARHVSSYLVLRWYRVLYLYHPQLNHFLVTEDVISKIFLRCLLDPAAGLKVSLNSTEKAMAESGTRVLCGDGSAKLQVGNHCLSSRRFSLSSIHGIPHILYSLLRIIGGNRAM